MSYEVKQVIVVRKDLNMRRGKESAQVAHAAMKFLAEAVSDGRCMEAVWLTTDACTWIDGSFAKIVVSVDSLEELDTVAAQARSQGLEVNEIVDAGLTEFDGVPTKTCVAIGPNKSGDIDKVTGHLKLR